MARAIWSGMISFGLVSIPVELYSATEAHEPTFHQFEKGTTDRIRYQRVNERTGAEVEYVDIVKGADAGGGNYVLLDQDELDSVAPGRSRSLDIEAFVELGEIDLIHFNRTYFLGPGNDEAKKAYALLRDAMADSGMAAIASFVMRNKEYLTAVRDDDDLLVLETLLFADEIRDPHEEIDNLPGPIKPSAQERRMAGKLIDSLSGPWKPAEYRDTYTDRVYSLIEAKKNNKDVQLAVEPPAATGGADLAQALRASLDASKKRPGKASPADPKPSARRKAPAGAKASASRKPLAGNPSAGKKPSGGRKPSAGRKPSPGRKASGHKK